MKSLVLFFLIALMQQQVDTIKVHRQKKSLEDEYFFGLPGGGATKMQLLMNMGKKDTSKLVLEILSGATTKVVSFTLSLFPSKDIKRQAISFTVRGNHLTSSQWDQLIAVQKGDIIAVSNVVMAIGRRRPQSVTIIISQ